jgi:hypothetical protein
VVGIVATGNTLCAALRDTELDTMTESQVMEWVDKAVKQYEDRQKATRRAKRAERELNAE